MSNVYCNVDNCKYRSKRRSKKQNKGGKWLYKCTKENLVLIPTFSRDEEPIANTIDCLEYEENQD